ncbi:hypothetical protein FHX06_006534 [Rhizobium sp. BK512]|nr:hypothetical protein [Rhizobium sp. BK512]
MFSKGSTAIAGPIGVEAAKETKIDPLSGT